MGAVSGLDLGPQRDCQLGTWPFPSGLRTARAVSGTQPSFTSPWNPLTEAPCCYFGTSKILETHTKCQTKFALKKERLFLSNISIARHGKFYLSIERERTTVIFDTPVIKLSYFTPVALLTVHVASEAFPDHVQML